VNPATRRRGGRAGDRGAGTVLALGLIGLLAAATIATATLGRVMVARHRASAAADLAALAVAAALVDASVTGGPVSTGAQPAAVAGAPGDASPSAPCRRGAHVATVNGARLTRCEAGEAGEVRVLVQVSTGVALPPFGVATAQARAGPAWPAPGEKGG
jgi:hypothetical protein